MKRRTGLGLLGVSAIVLAIVVTMGLTGILPFRQILASDRAVDLSQEQLAALVDENRRLEHQISALQTLEEVERLAREEFGLVMPGEIGYVSIGIPDSHPEATSGIDTDESDARPWWRTVWDFLTGRDMVDDG